MLRASAILAVGALCGCAHYTPRPLSAATGVAALETRSLDDPGLAELLAEEGSAPPQSHSTPVWSFDQLLLAAYYFHPDLDVARARLGVARAGQITAGQRPDPAASIFPSYDATTSIPSPWIVTSALEATIETAGKRGYRRAEAEARATAAGYHVAAVAWQVRTGVRRALVRMENAAALTAVRQRQVDIETESLQMLEAASRAGGATAYELTRARIDAQQGRLALTAAEQEVELAGVGLAATLGVPMQALERIHVSFDGLDELPQEAALREARRQALLNHPDLLSALADYAATDAALRLEIARQYPDLSIGPGFEFDQGDAKWGISLSLPLTLLNRNRGPIAEAEARRIESGARFNALQAQVLAAVERAVARYRAARARLAQADSVNAALQEQEQRATTMLRLGEISRLELSATRLQLAAAMIARVDAAAALRLAAVDLEQTLQTPAGLPPALWRQPQRAGQITETNS